MSTSSRKLEHLEITLYERVEGFSSTYFEHVKLVHQALPGFRFSDVDISTNFFKKRVEAPVVISGMTGGAQELRAINEKLALLAEKFGIAMGVGSQRAGIENPKVRESYSVVRKVAKDIPIIGNIGAPQIARGYGLKEVSEAVQMIEADAIAVHFNPAQEVFQPEGEPEYPEGIIDSLRDISKDLGVPLILKETGCGLSREFARKAADRGLKNFDVQGAGGTSWVAVEMYRASRRGLWKAESAKLFADWGIPTAASIIEVRYEVPEAFIIGSGGIRNGFDGAKAIALGADMVGMALPFLKAVSASKGEEFLRNFIFELKAVMFLTGARTLRELRKISIVIQNDLLNWISQRGIDLSTYLAKRAQS